MTRTVAVVGTDAAAEAMRQINPDVVPVYPITPQTAIVEKFADFVADGDVHTHMINVESEHSAMSAAIGASAAGARVMTCTASQGLALMFEELYVASGLRLPIVMTNVNRSLSAPINIHCDHGDSMGARDSGWIQIFSENAQEVYDNILQSIKIAEHADVHLPAMVMMDGFIISHAIDRVEYLDDSLTQKFIGEYTPQYSLLNAENPVSMGNFDGLGGFFFELKRQQEAAMVNAKRVIRQIGAEYKDISGRSYDFFSVYKTEDADAVILSAGSSCGTVREVVDVMRAEGKKIGAIKLRSFRPFPAEELAQELSRFKALAILDRSAAFAGDLGGPIFIETRSAFYERENHPLMSNYVYGLGGRDLDPSMIRKAGEEMLQAITNGKVPQIVNYLGLRD